MKRLLVKILLSCVLCSLQFSCLAQEKSVKEQLHDTYYTSISAASCLGVYLPEDSSEFSFMRSQGWEIAPYAFEDESVRTNFSIARNVCDDCGVELIGRSDDNEESFKIRFDTYINQTQPLLDYYKSNGLLVIIDKVNTPNETFEEVKKVIL